MKNRNTATITREAPGAPSLETRQSKPSSTDKPSFINPLALLIGVAIGFAGCCVGGYVTTLKNQYGKSFNRFGQLLGPEASFFPTTKQLVAIAHDQARKEQILVVIGGDSVFNGCGQPEHKLWSKTLQKLLGPSYAVVNFALRGGSPDTGGIVAATALAKQYKKIIFVASSWPEYYANPKMSNFEYFYWDALHKGMLDRNPERERFEQTRIAQSEGKEKTAREEIDLHKRIDSIFYFDDLWTTLGYQKCFTVWNSLTRDGFANPRRKFADPDLDPPPVDKRFSLGFEEIHYLKNAATRFAEKAGSEWHSKPGVWAKLEESAKVQSADLKSRSLIVLVRECPAYLAKLEQGERDSDAFQYETCAAKWKEAGFDATVVGADFVANDYSDPRHLAPAGGEKMARIMATKIESLAQKLGYLQDAQQ